MPAGRYFLKLTGAVLLGLVTLAIAVAAVFIFSVPLLAFFAAAMPFLVGAVLVFVAVVIIWMILYVAAFIGVAIYYAIRHPMQVSKEHGDYAIGKVKESGRRQRGDSEEENGEEKSEEE